MAPSWGTDSLNILASPWASDFPDCHATNHHPLETDDEKPHRTAQVVLLTQTLFLSGRTLQKVPRNNGCDFPNLKTETLSQQEMRRLSWNNCIDQAAPAFFSPPLLLPAHPSSHLSSSLDAYSEIPLGSPLPTLQYPHAINVWSALCLPHPMA